MVSHMHKLAMPYSSLLDKKTTLRYVFAFACCTKSIGKILKLVAEILAMINQGRRKQINNGEEGSVKVQERFARWRQVLSVAG